MRTKLNEALKEHIKLTNLIANELIRNIPEPCKYVNWYYDNIRMEWIFYNIKTNEEIDSITRHQYDHLRKNKNNFEDYLDYLNYKIKKEEENKNKEENDESL